MNAEHRFRRLLWIDWAFSGLALAALVYAVALRHTGMATPFQVGWSILMALVVAWVWSPWEPSATYCREQQVPKRGASDEQELFSLPKIPDDEFSRRSLEEPPAEDFLRRDPWEDSWDPMRDGLSQSVLDKHFDEMEERDREDSLRWESHSDPFRS
jgi:hypothetical protein